MDTRMEAEVGTGMMQWLMGIRVSGFSVLDTCWLTDKGFIHGVFNHLGRLFWESLCRYHRHDTCQCRFLWGPRIIPT